MCWDSNSAADRTSSITTSFSFLSCPRSSSGLMVWAVVVTVCGPFVLGRISQEMMRWVVSCCAGAGLLRSVGLVVGGLVPALPAGVAAGEFKNLVTGAAQCGSGHGVAHSGLAVADDDAIGGQLLGVPEHLAGAELG